LAQRRLRLSRGVATGVGVTLTLLLLLGLVSLVGAVVVRELGQLSQVLPELEDTARQGVAQLRAFLMDVAANAPQQVGKMLEETVSEVFDGNGMLTRQLTQQLPGVVTSVLSAVPGGALSIGTGVISGFLISARLPGLKQWICARLPECWRSKYLPAVRQLRHSLGQWLKAQGKLAMVTYAIVTVGLLLLGVGYAPVWALAVALVDAIPMVGSGVVLIPWALVSLLEGDHFRTIGLLCVYAAAFLSRSILEPRIVGKQLGLDPLVTLIALYTLFRLWGFGGLLLVPVAVAAVKTVMELKMEN